ncbi:rRNA maturation RNase YbeY [bacterium SCSIO 12741]|nr:rRNA maturation RNase YbeY [bacterium SCSIO 12741]
MNNPPKIEFYSEDIDFQIDKPEYIQNWIEKCVQENSFSIEHINYIFCSDPYLLDINQKYLNHDYFTDIITFDNSEPESEDLEGDLYISIDRVRDNALQLDQPFERELHRVMIHGVLHLMGFQDKTPEQESEMRDQEDKCLNLQP